MPRTRSTRGCSNIESNDVLPDTPDDLQLTKTLSSGRVVRMRRMYYLCEECRGYHLVSVRVQLNLAHLYDDIKRRGAGVSSDNPGCVNYTIAPDDVKMVKRFCIRVKVAKPVCPRPPHYEPTSRQRELRRDDDIVLPHIGEGEEPEVSVPPVTLPPRQGQGTSPLRPVEIRRLAGRGELQAALPQAKWQPLQNTFFRNPHLVNTKSGDRMVGDRLFPFFHLQSGGDAAHRIPVVVDYASVKSVTSTAVMRSLYQNKASVAPFKTHQERDAHTRLFWTRLSKQRLAGHGTFALSGTCGSALDVTIHEGVDFLFDMIVLGMDFLRKYPNSSYCHSLMELQFGDLRVPFEYVLVPERYFYDEKKKKVLMGNEAHAVLFPDNWDDQVPVDVSHIDPSKLRTLQEIAPRTAGSQ